MLSASMLQTTKYSFTKWRQLPENSEKLIDVRESISSQGQSIGLHNALYVGRAQRLFAKLSWYYDVSQWEKTD